MEERKEIKLGNIYGFTGGNYAGNVYDRGGISPCMSTFQGGNQQPMVVDVEKGVVAMRGRNPENPSDRTAGVPTEQRLEPNTQGISNTLTSVQKDNLVLEKIKINQPTAAGYVECEVGSVADLSYITSKTRRGRVQEGGSLCPTLCAEEKDICRIEIGDADFYTLIYQDGEWVYYIRIRKLIPLECWRLMGFADEDFLKAEKVCSNTQLYKQAGNSIVKNVLVAIIGQFFDGCEGRYKEL